MIRDDFPILKEEVNGKPLIYLDNAATMQMPIQVMNRMSAFYNHENANIHRGIHWLSEQATESYEQVRSIVAEYLHLNDPQEIIFTSGTTDSINMVADMMRSYLQSGDEIVVTQMEHHSNFIPWMKLADENDLTFTVVPVRGDGKLDLEAWKAAITERTRLVAVTQVSNVTGIENPLQEMIAYTRANSNAMILVDGAQGVVHCDTNLQSLQPDFYCFSGHKLGAPTGTGVLYMKKAWMKQFEPARYGGGTVQSVTLNGITYLEGPSIYEPGTPNYAGVIGLGGALSYWREHREAFQEEQECMQILEQGLKEIPGIRVLGETTERKGSVAITIEGMHSFDFSRFLDQYGIAARSGHHCAMPYLQALGAEHAVRFSVAPYNTCEEMHRVVAVCTEIMQIVANKPAVGRRRRR